MSVEVDDKFEIKGAQETAQLHPFDEIVVRSAPDFELQEYVEINGAVMYPGSYALVSDNETISSVIKRAGGLTLEAEPKDATLYRAEANKGFVVTYLDHALKSPGTLDDHILVSGDVLNIPKKQTLVTIKTANTKAYEVLDSRTFQNGQINVAFTKNKRAGWYIRHYVGGFAGTAIRSKTFVEAPNGKISRTHNFDFIHFYPKVKNGSTIKIASKPVVAEKNKKERKKVDWDKALTQILSVAGTMATMALAIAALKKL